MAGRFAGNFGVFGDSDWFRARFEAGKTYTITAGNNAIVTLGLMLPDGTPFSPARAYSNSITFVAPVSGDYWVSATATGGVGSYIIDSFELNDTNPADLTTTLTLGVGQSTSVLNSVGDDWYSLNLTAGQAYLLRGSLTSTLYMLDSSGNLLELSGTQLHFTPDTSGVYYVGISPLSNSYDIMLEAVSDDYGETISTAGNFAVGTPASGVWEAGTDRDWHAISLTAGNSYRFTWGAGAGPLASTVQVYDAEGNLVSAALPSLVNGSVIFSPETSGTYYVSANTGYDNNNPHGNWNYTVTATLVTGDLTDNSLTTGTLAIGVDRPGTWQAPGDVDWYAVTLTSGQSYSFSIESDHTGMALALYDSAGNEISSSLESAWTGTPNLYFTPYSYTATTTGTYYLAAKDLEPQGGPSYTVKSSTYTDDFSDNNQTTGTLAVGSTVDGIFEALGDRDWFAVQLTAGISYAHSGSVIRDAQGNALSRGQHFSPLVSGTYFLEAAGGGGAYSVGIAQVADDYREDMLSTGIMRRQLVGTVGNDTLAGSWDHEVISGGDGDDWIDGADGEDILIGGNGADILYGGSGNDSLQGGAGADYMDGGAGNDVYLLTDATDTVVEASDAGIDTVNATFSAALGENIENLNLAGTAATGIGNNLANIITGNGGANSLYGGDGADTLRGAAGNDYLSGGAGADVMNGGSGDDVYIVSEGLELIRDNTTDIIMEAVGGGYDSVYANTSGEFRLQTGAEVELLATYGTGDAYLTGNEFSQSIYGGAGNDALTGGGGTDSMRGLDGNDGYTVDSSDDLVFEDVGQGHDTVVTTVTYILLPGSEVERLVGQGAGNIDLYGNEFAQTIDGNNRNNYISGGAGADLMIGRVGDDIYIIDNAGDQVFEDSNDGYDAIYTNISYSLGGSDASIQVLATYGSTGDLVLEGNRFAQSIYGGAGNDILRGNGGNDYITGNGGTDIAEFAGLMSSYTITVSGGVATVVDNDAVADGYDGIDTIYSVETLRFKNGETFSISGQAASSAMPAKAEVSRQLMQMAQDMASFGGKTGEGLWGRMDTRPLPDSTGFYALS